MLQQRINCEDAVVVVLLRHPEAALKFDIQPEFFLKWHELIKAINEISSNGLDVDMLTISQHIKNPDTLKAISHLLIHGTGSIGNMQAYLNYLQGIEKSAQIKQVLSVAIADIESGEKIDDVVSGLMQSTLMLATDQKAKNNLTIKDAMAVFVDKLEETFDARDTGGIGIKTGIKYLDSIIGGLHPSDMIVVGARPGVGKTSFALSVIMSAIKSGVKVGFVSTEMSANQVMLRITSMDSSIAAHKLRDADLQDEDWTRLTGSINRLVDLPLRICDKPNMTAHDVLLQSKAWMIDGGIDFIVIDYLTRVKIGKPSGNQVQDVGDVVTAIKNVARILDIPVMVLAQLNRQAAQRKPIMSDLRDSGVIEQEADQIIMLHRDYEVENAPAEILIEKNRHGESSARILCNFDKQTMRWEDLHKDYDYI